MAASTRANRDEDIGNGHNSQQSGSSRSQEERRIAARAEIVTHIEEFEMVDYLKKVGYYLGHL